MKHQHPALEPVGSRMDMTDNDSTFCASQNTTNSSKGRKLRQVLQKKQLDVLLQTYSSLIDEPSEDAHAAASDFYSISRKSSLEGNLNAPLPRSTGSMPTRYSYKAHDVDDSSRARMRNKSLITDEDEYTVHTAAEDYASVDSSPEDDDYIDVDDFSSVDETEDESDFAVVASKKGRKQLKETTEVRRRQKKTSAQRRKKAADLKARLSKASEALKGFSSRAAEKNMEILADFQAVTVELRHHLSSGANIVFEDLADRFDGIVENLFADHNNEQRDDTGPSDPSQSQSANQSRQGAPQIVDPNFHPLSHDEALEEMNRQVSELLLPVKVLTHNVQTNIGCTAGAQGDFLEGNRDLPISSLASF